MGFTTANHDAEYDLNYNPANLVFCTTSPTSQPNSQSSFASGGGAPHNFVNWARANQPGNTGHNDPLYIWNEDIYEFMLID